MFQVWPEEIEEFFTMNKDSLPQADIDLSIAEYAKLCLSVLDIPYHDDNLIESLYLFARLHDELILVKR